jgi:hypothetical protein
MVPGSCSMMRGTLVNGWSNDPENAAGRFAGVPPAVREPAQEGRRVARVEQMLTLLQPHGQLAVENEHTLLVTGMRVRLRSTGLPGLDHGLHDD